jgi:DNA invertase Pin-like site-specific DNA recombinase
MNREQITAGHRSRLAVVYVRQSSLHQVINHTESQRRQRNLAQLAKELGWSAEQTLVVDDDQGETASRSGRRFGFDEMVAMAALGKVGIILGLEVSRLARGNHDWYHLLDVCGITRTLIADEEALYDPGAYNDRLLLGLKGTMSEAELHQIKQRLVESARAKAKRGELRRRLAPGFVWDEAGRIQKHPDEQVATAIALVFQRFDQVGTIHQTHLSLAEDGIQLPVCVGRAGLLVWRPATPQRIARILKNPIYAGAYAYGRRQTEEYLDASQRPRKRKKEVQPEAWHALLKDHHEGYISWEQYETNQQRIRSNWHGPSVVGAPREGESLLQGLVLCGRCGRPMNVSYGRDCRQIRYLCKQARAQTAAPTCQGFGAWRLERAVESLLLESLSPLGMEAMLAAAKCYADDHAAERTRCMQKIERARYEVRLARRQYEAVDPDHRLVARELERRYDQALGELERTEKEAEEHLKGLEGPLNASEEHQLRNYAKDLAALWHASTTRPQDRKRIARCLIESAVVTAERESTTLKAVVHWKGGEETTVEVAKGRTGVHRYVCSDELVELVRTLAKEFSDAQIARILHRKRLQTPKGRSFQSYHVANVRNKHGIPPGPAVPLQGPGVYTAEEAGRLLEVDRGSVIRWVEIGLLKGGQVTSGAPWRIVVTEVDLQKLKPTEPGEDWLPLKGAARELKVSLQTVLQKVQSGELQGVRVRKGRRIGWRIRLPARTCDDQPTLF